MGKENKHVLSILVDCVFIITNFDLWMSKGAHNVFALVMNFLKEDWVTKHITIGLFNFSEISS
jgi:putative flippase GtrA